MKKWSDEVLVMKSLIYFKAINRSDIMDTDMEIIMDTIVDSLFCFFVTLGKFIFVLGNLFLEGHQYALRLKCNR